MKTVFSILAITVKLLLWIVLIIFIASLFLARHIFSLMTDIQRDIMK